MLQPDRRPSPRAAGERQVDLWAYTELLLGFALGFVLHLLKLNSLANVSFLLGPALTGSRILLSRKIDDKLEPVRSLAQMVDLEQQIDDVQLAQLVKAYYEVIAEDFHPMRSEMVQETTKRLLRLAREERSDVLATGEYYRWLLPLIQQAPSGSTIWAVSMMLDCEWNDSPSEERFLELNMDAVDRGVTVERVFIVRQEQLADMFDNKGVQEHANKKGSKLKPLIVLRGDLEATDRVLLRDIGHGFIAFDDRVALIDVSSPDGMRGYVVRRLDDVQRLARVFEGLKNLGRAFDHPIIRAKVESCRKSLPSNNGG